MTDMIVTETLQRKGSKYLFIRASFRETDTVLCIGDVEPVLEVHWQAARRLAERLEWKSEVAPVGHHDRDRAYFEPWRIEPATEEAPRVRVQILDIMPIPVMNEFAPLRTLGAMHVTFPESEHAARGEQPGEPASA